MSLVKLDRNIIKTINPFNKQFVRFYLMDKSVTKRFRLIYHSDRFKLNKIKFIAFPCQNNIPLIEKSYYASYYNYLNNGNHNNYSHFKSMRRLKEEQYEL